MMGILKFWIAALISVARDDRSLSRDKSWYADESYCSLAPRQAVEKMENFATVDR